MPGKTWAIEPHTRAKLAILRAYLQAWFPILGLGREERVVYIDGFAGPGRYECGEEGSPLIALKAVLNQPVAIGARIDFHFVEADPEVAEHLRAELHALDGQIRGRPRLQVTLHCREFADIYPQISSSLSTETNIVPTFALIDPFGWTGVPFRIVDNLLGRPKTEVMFNFMHEEISRFLGHSQQPDNFDDLFGTSRWRDLLGLAGYRRMLALHDLYRSQLLLCARYVRSFTMVNQANRVDYFLFFATKSIKGLERMKEAMWKVAPTGDFCFSDATDPRALTLFGDRPDLGTLQDFITNAANGRHCLVDDLYHTALTDTAFLKKHVREVLRDAEGEGLLDIQAPPDRRRKTFPEKRNIRISLKA